MYCTNVGTQRWYAQIQVNIFMAYEVTQKVKSTDNPTDHELFKKFSFGLERVLASMRAATRRARSAATSSHPPKTPAKSRGRIRGKSRLGNEGEG